MFDAILIATLAFIGPTSDCVVEPRSTQCVVSQTVHTVTTKPVMSAEAKRAFSHRAKDKRGFEPSLYRGMWWDPKWRDIRACIMDRESGGSYWAFNRSSTARGAYQFLDSQWRQSLVWMFIAESKITGDGLISEAKKLRKKPIHRWSRYWQDRAFYTALRHGEGLHHWRHQVPGTGCF
jgi:hypothetical protein